jgi:hypothetical protein
MNRRLGLMKIAIRHELERTNMDKGKNVIGYRMVDPSLYNERRHGRVRSHEDNKLDVVIGVPVEDIEHYRWRNAYFRSDIAEEQVTFVKVLPTSSMLFPNQLIMPKGKGIYRVSCRGGPHCELRIDGGTDCVHTFPREPVKLLMDSKQIVVQLSMQALRMEGMSK